MAREELIKKLVGQDIVTKEQHKKEVNDLNQKLQDKELALKWKEEEFENMRVELEATNKQLTEKTIEMLDMEH